MVSERRLGRRARGKIKGFVSYGLVFYGMLTISGGTNGIQVDVITGYHYLCYQTNSPLVSLWSIFKRLEREGWP